MRSIMKNFKKSRFIILGIAFFLVFSIIILRLYDLMIVSGESYRNISENRILKTTTIKGNRGEIKDRHGRVLAGNKAGFNIEILRNQDFLNNQDEILLNLTTILNTYEEGYSDDFPIYLNEDGEFEYVYDRKIADWKESFFIEEDIDTKDIIEILRYRYEIESEDIDDIFNIFNRLNLDVPINKDSLEFNEEIRKRNWLSSYGLEADTSAEDAIYHLKREVLDIEDIYTKQELRDIIAIRTIIHNNTNYHRYESIPIVSNVSIETVIAIEENIHKYPGIVIETEPIRYYPHDNLASHTIGHLGRIAQEHEIERYVRERGYNPNDMIGKLGLEQSFEDNLRGEYGERSILVDSRGRFVEELDIKPSTPGDNLITTIDLELQRKSEQILEDVIKSIQTGEPYEGKWGTDHLVGANGRVYNNAKSGSVIVTDINTGEILALANYPSFDPNLFVRGVSFSDWAKLQPENPNDPLSPAPMANLAMSSAVPPGSIYKMITGLAALEHGFPKDYTLYDSGFIEVGNRRFTNWYWNQFRGIFGWQDMVEAMGYSNNTFFYSLIDNYDFHRNQDLPFEMSIQDMLDFSKKFGLDDPTGVEINLPREVSGVIPSEERKRRQIENSLRFRLSREFTNDVFTEEKSQDEINDLIEEIISYTEENPSRGFIHTLLHNNGVKSSRLDYFTDMIKFDYFSQGHWSRGDGMNLSIGQGDHRYTPLQMVRYTMALGNNGYLHDLTLVKHLEDFEGNKLDVFEKEENKIEFNDEDNLRVIQEGMRHTTEESSTRMYFEDLPITVAGKTGTAEITGSIPPKNEAEYLLDNLHNFGVTEAQLEREINRLREEQKDNFYFLDEGIVIRNAIKSLNPSITDSEINSYRERYSAYSWFTGYAPYEDPEIAITVLIYQGGTGGHAAPVFREIVAEYFGLNEESNKININEPIKN